MPQNESCCFTVIFNVCIQSSKKSYVKHGKYTDLPTYFSEKNIWLGRQVFRGIAFPKFQENRSVLSNAIECGYLTAIFYHIIPAFHVL